MLPKVFMVSKCVHGVKHIFTGLTPHPTLRIHIWHHLNSMLFFKALRHMPCAAIVT